MIKVLFFVFALIVAYLLALNGRYNHIGGYLYFDKWTKEARKYEVILGTSSVILLRTILGKVILPGDACNT